MNRLLQIQDIQIEYRGTQKITFDIREFSIASREFVVLRGGSGTGKTTLFRLLDGSLKPIKGSIQRPRTAKIYQDLRLVQEKTVLENVLSGSFANAGPFSLRINDDDKKFAIHLIQEIGLENKMHHLVSELSGGQKQRVAIARALMRRPELLIGDECFSHLDDVTAQDIFQLLRRLSTEIGFSVLISMHAPHVPYNLFDREAKVTDILQVSVQKQRKRIFNQALIAIFLLMTIASLILIESTGFDVAEGFSEFFGLAQRFIPTPDVIEHMSWKPIGQSLLQTIFMAFLGSGIGFLVALPLSLIAVEKFSFPPLAKAVRIVLMFLRSIPSIVWALVFVASLGIGHIAGIFALGFYSAGLLGKLQYEAFENAEVMQFDALRSLGASRWQSFWFGVFPSLRSTLLSQYIFCLEYNIRSASIMGLVGAGGIGQELLLNIEWRRFEHAGTILLVMFLLVYLTDKLSLQVRKYVNQDRAQ